VCCRQLVPQLKDAVDPYHWPALVETNVEFAKNVAQEAFNRGVSGGAPATRCIASYMVLRRETIGTRPCFVLMRSTRRLYLPKHVLQHPLVAEMENRALDMVYIANVCLIGCLKVLRMLTAVLMFSGHLFL